MFPRYVMTHFAAFISPTNLFKIKYNHFRLFTNLKEKYANVEKLYCILGGNEQIEVKVTWLYNGQLVERYLVLILPIMLTE